MARYYFHLLPGDITHISPITVNTGTLSKLSLQNFFIYIVTKKSVPLYVPVIEKPNCKVVFLDECDNGLIPRSSGIKDIFVRIINKILKLAYRFSPYDKFQALKKESKKGVLIVHGELGMFSDGLLCYIRDNVPGYSWVCWGETAYLDKDPYRSFVDGAAEIVALMSPDTNIIKGMFPLKKVITLPYAFDASELDKIGFSPSRDILIGNSAHYISDYERILPSLGKLDPSITIMLNYGGEKAVIDKFEQKCSEIFTDVVFWDKVYPKKEYYREIAKHKLYVSPIERQSGLGAIYAATVLGLKLYLAGANYEWMKSRGFVVHHVNELQFVASRKDLLYYSFEDAEYNTRLFKQQSGEVLSQWQRFVDSL